MAKGLMFRGREQAKKVVSTGTVRTAARPRKVSRRQKTPMLDRVLVPTDFSKEAEAGVRCGVSMAQSFGADLEFIHVVDTPPALSRMRAEPLAMRNAALEMEAREKLQKLTERTTKGESGVKSFVTVGKPFDRIVDLARRQKADVIVMSTRGRTGLKRMMLGSTAEYVVRHAQCPVLTVPSDWEERRFRPTKIFVPIDFSDLSRGALGYARLVAEEYGAEIVLGHVVSLLALAPMAHTLVAQPLVEPTFMQMKAELEEWAEELREWTDVPVTAKVGVGRPADQLGAMAKLAKADLIVLTTHGMTGLKRVLMGSTAEAVVRTAKCPVLVVRGARKGMVGM